MSNITPACWNMPSLLVNIGHKDEKERQKFCDIDVSPAVFTSLEEDTISVSTLEEMTGMGDFDGFIVHYRQLDPVAIAAYRLGLFPYDPYIDPGDLECVSYDGARGVKQGIVDFLTWHGNLSSDKHDSIVRSLAYQAHHATQQRSRLGKMPSVRMTITYRNGTCSLKKDIDVSYSLFVMFDDDYALFTSFKRLLEDTEHATDEQFINELQSSGFSSRIGIAVYRNGLAFNDMGRNCSFDMMCLEAHERDMDEGNVPLLRWELKAFIDWFSIVKDGGLSAHIISDIHHRIMGSFQEGREETIEALLSGIVERMQIRPEEANQALADCYGHVDWA